MELQTVFIKKVLPVPKTWPWPSKTIAVTCPSFQCLLMHLPCLRMLTVRHHTWHRINSPIPLLKVQVLKSEGNATEESGFWDVMVCHVSDSWRSEGTLCLHLQGVMQSKRNLHSSFKNIPWPFKMSGNTQCHIPENLNLLPKLSECIHYLKGILHKVIHVAYCA